MEEMSLKSKKIKATDTVILRSRKTINHDDYLLKQKLMDSDFSLVYFRVPKEKCCYYYDELIPTIKYFNPKLNIYTIDLSNTTLHYDFDISSCPSILVISSGNKPVVIKKQLSTINFIEEIQRLTNIRLSIDV